MKSNLMEYLVWGSGRKAVAKVREPPVKALLWVAKSRYAAPSKEKRLMLFLYGDGEFFRAELLEKRSEHVDEDPQE
ncbi:hypothetical protein M2360_001541 [Rhizobium sp. SG_E_25_P2]|nr:hypothetical protein [Rhizobium sp. SG_E_25_P2]